MTSPESDYNEGEAKAMTTAIKAIYENGVFKPKEAVQLEDRTEVDVLIPSAGLPDAEDPTGWKAAEALIGSVRNAPSDMAEHHDQYLYGRPHE